MQGPAIRDPFVFLNQRRHKLMWMKTGRSNQKLGLVVLHVSGYRYKNCTRHESNKTETVKACIADNCITLIILDYITRRNVQSLHPSLSEPFIFILASLHRKRNIPFVFICPTRFPMFNKFSYFFAQIFLQLELLFDGSAVNMSIPEVEPYLDVAVNASYSFHSQLHAQNLKRMK